MDVGRVGYSPSFKATMTGRAAQGEGGSFRLRPAWPQKDTLEYLQQLTTVVLLLFALAILVYWLFRSPQRAAAMVLSRVGMKP